MSRHPACDGALVVAAFAPRLRARRWIPDADRAVRIDAGHKRGMPAHTAAIINRDRSRHAWRRAAPCQECFGVIGLRNGNAAGGECRLHIDRAYEAAADEWRLRRTHRGQLGAEPDRKTFGEMPACRKKACKRNRCGDLADPHSTLAMLWMGKLS